MNNLLYLIIYVAAVCALFPLPVSGGVFSGGVKYRIVSNDRGKGAVGLGAFHNSVFDVYYVGTDEDISGDCWWYIDERGTNKVVFRNVRTGQYLTYTSGSGDSPLALTNDSPSEWKVRASPTMNFMFSVQTDIIRFIYLNPLKDGSEANMLKVTRYDDNYSYFNIYDEEGNRISVGGLDDETGGGADAD